MAHGAFNLGIEPEGHTSGRGLQSCAYCLLGGSHGSCFITVMCITSPEIPPLALLPVSLLTICRRANQKSRNWEVIMLDPFKGQMDTSIWVVGWLLGKLRSQQP